MKKQLQITAAIVLFIIAFQSTALSQEAKKWSFSLEPYALLTTIEGTASVGRIVGSPIKVDFGTILDNLEIAGMLHFEVFHEDTWGLIMDYAFVDLKSNIKGSRDGVAKAGIRQGILEGMIAQRIVKGTLSLIHI